MAKLDKEMDRKLREAVCARMHVALTDLMSQMGIYGVRASVEVEFTDGSKIGRARERRDRREAMAAKQ